MINQYLVGYINTQLSAGYKIEVIRTALLKYGHNPLDIEDTIRYITGSNRNYALNRNQNLNPNYNRRKVLSESNIFYGGFWFRFSAGIWDFIILGIPYMALQITLYLVTHMDSIVYILALAYLGLTRPNL